MAEQLLFAKYPEVLGHDTKGVVSDYHGHWLYSVGFRENMYTYIAMRGILANQTLAMFKFAMEVALPYLHGVYLRATRTHMCDGDQQLCDALASISQLDGLSPSAVLLRCGWHVIDRAIIRIFGSGNKLWHRCLIRAFWMWQQVETFEGVKKFLEWLQNDFITAQCIQDDMSTQDKNLYQAFIWSLWNTRKGWARAFNMELGAFDLRTNSFVEVQNAVLTEDVGVSGSMKITTMIQKESKVFENKARRLEHGNFQRKIRPLSQSARGTDISIGCDLAKKVMCPKPLKRLIRQVQLATSCLRNLGKSEYGVCTYPEWERCTICSALLLDTQKKLIRENSGVVRLHMKVFVEENLNKKVHFEDLEFSFAKLLRSAPVKKEWRVVTCIPNGESVMLRCSCGYGMRNFSVCLHCSMICQKVSHYQCSGCEEQNIHIRDCELYAGLEDIRRVHRTADDWIGVRCSHITIDTIKESFEPFESDDTGENGSDGSDEREDNSLVSRPPIHGTRQQSAADEMQSTFASSRSAILATSRTQYYELQHICDEGGTMPEFQRRMKILNDAMLDAKRKLPAAVGGGSARPTHTSTDKQRRQSRRQRQRRPSPPPPAAIQPRRRAATPPPPPLLVRNVRASPSVVLVSSSSDVPLSRVRFNESTMQMEYFSEQENSSDSSSDTDAPTSRAATRLAKATAATRTRTRREQDTEPAVLAVPQGAAPVYHNGAWIFGL